MKSTMIFCWAKREPKEIRTPDSAMIGKEAAIVKEQRVGSGESGSSMVSGSESFDMGREMERLTVADEAMVVLMLGAESASGSVGNDGSGRNLL